MNNVVNVQDPIVLDSLLWDLIEMTDSYILNMGIFTSFEKAVGEAFRIASGDLESEYGGSKSEQYTISPLFKLEADGGWGFEIKESTGRVIKTFYILEVCNEGDVTSNQC